MAKALSLTELRGKQHYHACATCKFRVYICSCATPGVNERCQLCRGLLVPEDLHRRAPHPCCISNCKQLTYRDDLILYKLAGPGPWFQCKTCKRNFGAYPTEKWSGNGN